MVKMLNTSKMVIVNGPILSLGRFRLSVNCFYQTTLYIIYAHFCCIIYRFSSNNDKTAKTVIEDKFYFN